MHTGLLTSLAFRIYYYLVATVTSTIQLELQNFNAIIILNIYTCIRMSWVHLPYHEIPFLYMCSLGRTSLLGGTSFTLPSMALLFCPTWWGYWIRTIVTIHGTYKCKWLYKCMSACHLCEILPFSKVNDEQCVRNTISELCSLLGEFNCLSPCLMYHDNCGTSHHK